MRQASLFLSLSFSFPLCLSLPLLCVCCQCKFNKVSKSVFASILPHSCMSNLSTRLSLSLHFSLSLSLHLPPPLSLCLSLSLPQALLWHSKQSLLLLLHLNCVTRSFSPSLSLSLSISLSISLSMFLSSSFSTSLPLSFSCTLVVQLLRIQHEVSSSSSSSAARRTKDFGHKPQFARARRIRSDACKLLQARAVTPHPNHHTSPLPLSPCTCSLRHFRRQCEQTCKLHGKFNL